MYAVGIIPGVILLIARFIIPESPQWVYASGKFSSAEKEVGKLLKRTPQYPRNFKITTKQEQVTKISIFSLFNHAHIRSTVLASIPWFLQDLATYGIGVFTPTILLITVGHKLVGNNLTSVIYNDLIAARGATIIDTTLLVGIILAILFVDKIGRIKLQIIGFLGCTAGLLMISQAMRFGESNQQAFIFIGFMLFNMMTNFGPNATTYLISGEVYPTKLRARGAGFAATFAKMGAVIMTFIFPIFLADLGIQLLLLILVLTSLLGAWVTFRFRIETKDVRLDE